MNRFKRVAMVTGFLLLVGVVYSLTTPTPPKKAVTPSVSASSPSDLKVGEPITVNTSETSTSQPKVLFTESGSGTKSTKAFTTGDSWTLSYSYDCSNVGFQDNFQIYINNTDGTSNADSGPNVIGTSGQDTEYYYSDAGGHNLTVNTGCNWTITVKG